MELIRSRKQVVLGAIALQGFSLMLVAASPAMARFRLAFLFAAASLYWIFCSLAAPAWQSWMGDLVPTESRGRFFGQRNRIGQIVTLLALLLGGAILQWLPGLEGFLIVLGLGTLGRGLSLIFVSRQEDRPAVELEATQVSFRAFLAVMHRDKFGRYVLYAALFAFAVNISASYFTPYMLEELKLSYLHFVALLAAMMGFKFIATPYWGRLIDRHGSRRPLVMSCILFCLPPLLWLISQNYFYLLTLQIVAGVGIGGFELCSFNFLLENSDPQNRTRFAAYYEVLTGLGVVAGALTGGLLLRYPPMELKPYVAIFLISGLLRLALSAWFLPGLKAPSSNSAAK